MKRLAFVIAGFLASLLLPSTLASADPFTFSFTAADAKAVMEGYGAPLHDSTYQWGLTGLRASPWIAGGGYDIVGGFVSGVPDDWWTFEDLGNLAAFQALPGSEHLGVAAHPLYMIADQPASSFQSFRYDNTLEASPGRSTFTGVCDLSLDSTGCNVVNLVPDDALFSFSFLLDPGTALLGWQFLVDGTKYYLPSTVPPDYGSSRWVADFIGGDTDLDPGIFGPGANGGGLPHNTGVGYQVPLVTPEPASLSLMALGIGAALVRFRRRTS